MEKYIWPERVWTLSLSLMAVLQRAQSLLKCQTKINSRSYAPLLSRWENPSGILVSDWSSRAQAGRDVPRVWLGASFSQLQTILIRQGLLVITLPIANNLSSYCLGYATVQIRKLLITRLWPHWRGEPQLSAYQHESRLCLWILQRWRHQCTYVQQQNIGMLVTHVFSLVYRNELGVCKRDNTWDIVWSTFIPCLLALSEPLRVGTN